MKIVIIGGGLSGLLAGLLLGRNGHTVSLIERDGPPPATGPDAIFERWARRGVPQIRQPHVFLGRSVRVLRDEAPDVLDEVLAAGALRLPIDLGDGSEDAVICSRRPPYEAVLRRAVEHQAGVTVRAGVAVTDLAVEHRATPQVCGVRLDNGEQLPADLVVDAAGRRSPTLRLLAGHGLRPVPEVAQDCGFIYLSRHYRLRSGADYPILEQLVMANLGWARAMAFPGDRGTFSLLAAVASIDPLRQEISTEQGFARLHAAVPRTRPWLEAGEPISPITAMARVENRYRRLVESAEPIVTGLVLLGDAAMHTNPTLGRGVSLAFAHAQHLAATVDRAGDLAEFAIDFDRWTDAHIGAWYQSQAGADASMGRRMQALVRGEDAPQPDRMERIREAVIDLSSQAGPAALRLRRMRNLIDLPSDVLSDPIVVAAAEAYVAQQGTIASMGPSRLAFACGASTLSGAGAHS